MAAQQSVLGASHGMKLSAWATLDRTSCHHAQVIVTTVDASQSGTVMEMELT